MAECKGGWRTTKAAMSVEYEQFGATVAYLAAGAMQFGRETYVRAHDQMSANIELAQCQ